MSELDDELATLTEDDITTEYGDSTRSELADADDDDQDADADDADQDADADDADQDADADDPSV
jgi:hypothetical protein